MVDRAMTAASNFDRKLRARRRFQWDAAINAKSSLKLCAVKVALCLSRHMKLETAQCNPSIKSIMAQTSLSERGVQLGIRALVAEGFIECGSRKGGRGLSTSYRLLLPVDNKPKTPHGGAPFRGVETLHETLHETQHETFHRETPHETAQNPARNEAKPRTMVHPNLRTEENREEKMLSDKEEEGIATPRPTKVLQQVLAKAAKPFPQLSRTDREHCKEARAREILKQYEAEAKAANAKAVDSAA
jgi:hypothetical protein